MIMWANAWSYYIYDNDPEYQMKQDLTEAEEKKKLNTMVYYQAIDLTFIVLAQNFYNIDFVPFFIL